MFIRHHKVRLLNDDTGPVGHWIKEARQSKSRFRAMLIVVCDINGVIMKNRVPDGLNRELLLLKDFQNVVRMG